MRTRLGVALLGAALLGAGCDTDLNLTNPNAPTEQTVLTDLNGVIALGVGVQRLLAGGTAGEGLLLPTIRSNGLVTDELGPLNRTLASDLDLYDGGGIDPAFLSVSQPYTWGFRVVRSADNLIASAPTAVQGFPALQSGLLAVGRLHKAMALGYLIQQYERIPVSATLGGTAPQPRAVVLDTILNLLATARQDIANVSDAELAGLRSRVLDPGLDLRNTISAMEARYSLMAGRYQQAFDAAGRVDSTRVSSYSYTGTSVNPIYNYATELRYIAPLRDWARAAEAGDRRVTFWADTATAPADARPGVSVVNLRQYAARNDPFPIYLPGEMLLIQAEASARLGNLSRARDLINQVRTQCTPRANEPAACLPARTAEELPDLPSILRQIAYERRYELFLQGLRWEDLRRLDVPGVPDPKANFLPLPSEECRINLSAGCTA